MTEPSSRKALFTLLSFVFLVAALVAWAVWGGGDGSEPKPAAPAGVASADRQSVPEAGAAGAAGVATDPARDPGLRREAVPAQSVRAGAGQVLVRGRLVDPAGRPRPGEEMVLSASRQLGGFDVMDLGPDMDDERPRQRTDGEGSFAFPVAAGTGGAVNVAPGETLVLQGGPVKFTGSQADIELGDLTAVAASVVARVVQDAAGRPAEGVIVSATRDGLGFGLRSPRFSTTTDDQGRFRIAGLTKGTLHMRTASPRFLPHESEVSLGESEERLDLVLEVREGRAIAGQVLDDLGRPAAGVRVGARRHADRGAISVERFTPDEATDTDGNGLFTLSGLEGDVATVRAWGEGFTTAVQSNVAVGTSNLVLRLQRLGTVTGVLKADDGTPLSGSRVTAQPAGQQDGLIALDEAAMPILRRTMGVTAADGTFRIEGVTPGAVTVRATGDDHRPAQREGVLVRPGETAGGIELTAELGAAVAVTVLDEKGRPVEGASVRVVERQLAGGSNPNGVRAFQRIERDGGDVRVFGSDDENIHGKGTTGADGTVFIAGLPAGLATVKATHDALARPQPADVTIPATGTVEATLRMRPAGFAEITTLDSARQPVGQVRYVVTGPLGSDASDEHDGTSDDLGVARVGPLAPGTYRAEIELEPPGQRIGEAAFVVIGNSGARRLAESRVEFLVRAGETAAAELIKPVLTTVTGVVSDAEGPVSGITVEIAAVDGEDGVEVPGISSGPSDRTDSDGRYRIADLSAGKYEIRFGRQEQMIKARQPLELLSGEAERQQDLRLQGGVVKVRVTSADDGEPIEGAEVQLVRDGDRGSQGGRRPRRMMMISMTVDGNSGGAETTQMTIGGNQVKTDVDGEAEIKDVPPGTYALRLSDDKHVARTLPDQVVVDGAATDAGTVALEAGGRLRGRVVGLPTGGLGNVAIVEYRLVGGGDDAETQPATGGAFTLTGLKPGRYALRARALTIGPDAGTGENWGPTLEVDVKAGRNRSVELLLPKK